jgi:hypothetical protein
VGMSDPLGWPRAAQAGTLWGRQWLDGTLGQSDRTGTVDDFRPQIFHEGLSEGASAFPFLHFQMGCVNVATIGRKPCFTARQLHLTANSTMTTTPLTSNDHGKLFVFALLILPAAAFLVGAIPLLFILFGLFMLRRTNDFSHIETASRNFKIYCSLVMAGFIIAAVYIGSQAVDRGWESQRRNEVVFAISICAGIAGAYILALNYLFLNPLRRHRGWVQQNGIFSGRSKKELLDAEPVSIDIIQGERLRSFSVADELLKWAKLKEDGHISEQEFNEARAKLLQKS